MAPERYDGAQSVFYGEQTSQEGVPNLMERILSRDNFNMAYFLVIRNRGAEGVDVMTMTNCSHT